MNFAAGAIGRGDDGGRRLRHLVLAQRGADRAVERRQESVGHAAADDQMIHMLDQMFEDRELGRDLGSANHRGEGPGR